MISRDEINKNNLVAHYTYEHNDGDQIWVDECKFCKQDDGSFERHFKDGYYGTTVSKTISLEELKKELKKVKESPSQYDNPNVRGGYEIVKDFVEPTSMKVGDIVYFYEHWSDSIEKCKIEELKEIDGVKAAEVRSIGTVDIEGDIICNTYGTSTRRIKDLYPSSTAAYDAYFKKSIENTRKYKDEIKTINDLVAFPLDHCLNGGEYTDYDAKAAYKQKVKELLGIEFDDRDQVIENEDIER